MRQERHAKNWVVNKTVNHTLRNSAVLSALLVALPCAGADVNDSITLEVAPLVIVWASDATGIAPVVTDFIVGSVGAPDTDLVTSDGFTVITGSLASTNNNIGVGGFPLDFTGSPSGDFNTDTDGDGTLDADDVLTPFELDADFDVDGSSPNASFYVSSNAPFSITAEVTEVEVDPVFTAFSTAFLGFVDLVMEVAPVGAPRTDDGFTYGGSAQAPHSDGEQGGFITPIDLLDLVDTPTLVFTGNQRTAVSPGSIADQSVRFDVSYPLVGATVSGYDLSLGIVNFGVTVEYTVFVP